MCCSQQTNLQHSPDKTHDDNQDASLFFQLQCHIDTLHIDHQLVTHQLGIDEIVEFLQVSNLCVIVVSCLLFVAEEIQIFVVVPLN